MSVTIADILELPSLRQAKVVAGANGLSKIISSISVLETADTSYLVDDIFHTDEFFGSEIVITGFLNNLHDVDAQLKSIRRLAEGGEVGLIVFYVGIYLPSIDKSIIDFANKHDFVIIQMPPNGNLRYGEVISDVSEFIFNDRNQNQFILSDILARVSRLPEHQRTINSVLRMISDEIKATLILTDTDFNALNISAWPQAIKKDITEHLSDIYRAAYQENIKIAQLKNCYISAFPIHTDQEQPMHLFIIKESAPIKHLTSTQVTDIVRISLNIWGKGHSKIAIHELVRSILQDDPIKMHRLADIFHIDISKIHEMWIFSATDDASLDQLKEKKELLREHLQSCTPIVFEDIYQNNLLLFSSTLESEKEATIQATEMLEDILLGNKNITLSRFNNLETTSDVRNSYLMNQSYLEDAQKIFPNKKWFSNGDMDFAKECHKLIDTGEKKIHPYRAFYNRLNTCSSDWNAAETLATYMLDNQSSITQTAKALHVHINTVKYRLKVIDDFLGYSHSKMPDSMKLYYALALHRLLV